MLLLLKTACIALIGGTLFHLISMPLAWLLGSLTAVALARSIGIEVSQWPDSLHKVGLVLLGYALGANFIPEMFTSLFFHIPAMFLSTVALILFCVLFAFGISKLTGEGLTSLIIGSMPGGLSQMLLLGDEMDDADLSVVTLMQLIRVLCVIFLVPWLVIWLARQNDPSMTVLENVGESVQLSEPGMVITLLFFLLVCFLCGWLASKVHIPTPYLVGSILATILLIVAGLEASPLPTPLFLLSQLLIGTRLGLRVEIRKILALRKVALYAFLSSLLLLLVTFGIAFVIKSIYHVSFLSAYLGASPGGMVEMGITAKEVQADTLLVTGYQMFRIFFLILVVPPVLKWALKSWSRPKRDQVDHERYWETQG